MIVCKLYKLKYIIYIIYKLYMSISPRKKVYIQKRHWVGLNCLDVHTIKETTNSDMININGTETHTRLILLETI
jgi:hypothetical protein